jgi:recombination DNA repair RAD52 pathway protein
VSLDAEQVDALLAPLDGRRVRQVRGNAHLEAWDVRRHLLRVFGWGGWDFTVLSCDCISERSKWDPNDELKGRHSVVYRVVGRLTVKDRDGVVLAHFDDGATGDAQNQPALGDAHDMAIKTAMSQALKRCAVNLGDRYGLSLYNSGGTQAVVGRTLGNPFTGGSDASDHVESGEMEEGSDAA